MVAGREVQGGQRNRAEVSNHSPVAGWGQKARKFLNI